MCCLWSNNSLSSSSSLQFTMGFPITLLQSSSLTLLAVHRRVVGFNRAALVQTLCKERERGTRWPHPQHPAGRAGPEYGAPAKDLDLFCHLSHHIQILHFFLSSFFFFTPFCLHLFFSRHNGLAEAGPTPAGCPAPRPVAR